MLFGAMYDDSNTDSCDVTVIATGIGNKDVVDKNYVFANQGIRKNSSASSYKGAQRSSAGSQRSSASQAGKSSNLNNTNLKSSVKQESLDIPSFLRQPPRR